MFAYLRNISSPALVIINNFKGQVTDEVSSLLDVNDIDVCLLPPNCTDRLQLMDISVNRPAKVFLKKYLNFGTHRTSRPP